MVGFQHHSCCLHFIARRNGENIPIEMDSTSLVTGIREHFLSGIEHARVLVSILVAITVCTNGYKDGDIPNLITPARLR